SYSAAIVLPVHDRRAVLLQPHQELPKIRKIWILTSPDKPVVHREKYPATLRDGCRAAPKIRSKQPGLLPDANASFQRALSDSYVFVGPTIIKKVATILFSHALHENHIGHLANLLPILLGRENRFSRPRQEPAGVVTIKDRDSCAVDQIVICTV